MNCVHCNKEINFNYMEPTKTKLRELSECFNCNHFMDLFRRPDRSDCIVVQRFDVHGQPISHYMYGEGGGRRAGFGGDKWTIKYLDGRVVTTTNLWHQGEIPQHLLKYFPINAELVNETVAEMTRRQKEYEAKKNEA